MSYASNRKINCILRTCVTIAFPKFRDHKISTYEEDFIIFLNIFNFFIFSACMMWMETDG